MGATSGIGLRVAQIFAEMGWVVGAVGRNVAALNALAGEEGSTQRSASEEISGEEGSGTVFFSGCTMRCVFCQNREISRGKAGKEISVERLSEIFLELQEKGANNINLVTPMHYAPQIVSALDTARKNGLSLPIVWNTGGWELPESVSAVKNYADIWLSDFKYFDNSLAEKFSKILSEVLINNHKEFFHNNYDEKKMEICKK